MSLCEICGERDARPLQCNGDHAYHRHGMVHTILRGSNNDLAALCSPCHERDRNMWALLVHAEK